MKKKIIVISVAFIGFILAVTGNSWADRSRDGDRRQNRGVRSQEFSDRDDRHFKGYRVRGYHPSRRPYHPAHRFKPWFHKRHPYGVPNRFRPKFRHWRHHPRYWQGHPKRFFRHHRHAVGKEINNYHHHAGSYAVPLDEFHASAAASHTGFFVSVGVSNRK